MYITTQATPCIFLEVNYLISPDVEDKDLVTITVEI